LSYTINKTKLKAMRILLFLALVLFAAPIFSQKITLDGYVFEEHNRGFLNEVKVTVLDQSGVFVGEVISDLNGHFVIEIDRGKDYTVQFEKKIFQTTTEKISTVGKNAGDKVFIKKQLERQPGYLLEVTLAEKRYSNEIPTDGINGSRVEVYNVTKNKDELVIDSAKSPNFSTTLQQGNHYAIMIRKKGYFTKRMDAHVNIDGCYLCMEGFGKVSPGANLTTAEDNKLGTLIANIELDRIDTNRNLVLQNIYYAYNSAELTDNATKELDKLVTLLKINAGLVIELGSHTDTRGSDEFNLKLSQARAESAVAYITSVGGIDRNRIKGRGYGEMQILNRCQNGVACSEEEHIRNRRTELKIIGFRPDENADRSLGEMIRYEQLMKFASSNESEKEYKAPVGGAAPTNAPLPVEVMTKTPNVASDYAAPTATPNNAPVNSKTLPAKTEENAPRQAQTPPSVKQATQTVQVDQIVVAQNVPAESIEKLKVETAPEVAKEAPRTATTESAGNVKINLTQVDKTYSGYKVELFTSPNELPLTDPDLKMVAFDVMSDIETDKLKTGATSYMVGRFSAWGETERFLEKVKAKYPKAQIVDYFKGKRVGQ
jgi:outer membrane protein OmpA-like peptidoglycan-associated protein